MIKAYVRDANDFSMFIFHGAVSVCEIQDAVYQAMARNKKVPFEPVALIDTRGVRRFDAKFSRVLMLADRLTSTFSGSGHDLRIVILTPEKWKYGMAHMFAMAAASFGGARVFICETEEELLRLCNGFVAQNS